MKLLLQAKNDSRGFTIIELMIALAVLSILLIISALTLSNIGAEYVKGNNEATAQNTARNIVSDISSQIQLGGASPIYGPDNSPTSGSFCVGTTRYNFLVGQEVGDGTGNSTKHALWRDTMTTTGACPQITSGDMLSDDNPSSSGQELIPQNMRLSEFKVSQTSSGLWQISVGVAYGDDDLLCDPTAWNDCNTSWIASHMLSHQSNLKLNDGKIICIGTTGQQFCSVSNLSVTVAQRVSSS